MSASPAGRKRPRAHTGDQAAERAIFEATEQLLADERLHDLSVAQIIKAAGLSRASFYHYFSSKFEVVAALMARIWDEIYSDTHTELEGPWEDPGDALRSSLRTGMEGWFAHKAVIHAVLENQHAVPALAEAWSALSGRFAAALAEQIRREREAGRAQAGPSALPPETIATMLVCGAERIFYVGSTGTDSRMRTHDQRLDAIVTIALAAIYGSPTGPAAAKAA
ncbi:TetR/AcrR family transcriptional regulator [Paraconexibacter sp. AEG42_29]|uniref:TetR/AcrR family transcriptional regulator n=1 Tax=Paraconexibacter sp. AEG42_29 TaxID=2997339 RepID=UPI00339D6EDD